MDIYWAIRLILDNNSVGGEGGVGFIADSLFTTLVKDSCYLENTF